MADDTTHLGHRRAGRQHRRSRPAGGRRVAARRRRLSSAGLVVAALVLAGCSSTDPQPSNDPAASGATGPHEEQGTGPAEPDTRPAPDEAVAKVPLVGGEDEVVAAVYPVVRTPDAAVLTFDLEPTGDEKVFLGTQFGATDSPVVRSPGAIRLADLPRGEIYLPAIDAAGDYLGPTGYTTAEVGGTRMQIGYGLPPDDTEHLSLLLAGTALVADIPVIDGEPPTTEDPVDPGDIADEQVFSLGSYTTELDGAVATLSDVEEVEITLGSDVLFDSRSAELDSAARALLDTAVARLEQREPGTISVVGHTDDRSDAAYNQQLSEDRAEAVAEALAERIDTDEYPLETEGRGQDEPLVDNTDDEARATNRRVTLTLTTTVAADDPAGTAGELPPFEDGPVATAEEGVEIDSHGSWLVNASAREVDDHLVVDLDVTLQDEDSDSGTGGHAAFLSGVWSYRGTGTNLPQSAVSGITVLSGSTAIYPMDYRIGTRDGGTELWQTASDLDKPAVAPGATWTTSLVYPALDDAETITVQLATSLGAEAFRLTDVPITTGT